MTMQLLQYQKYQSTKFLFQGESLIGHHFISNKRRQKNEKERKGKEREKKNKAMIDRGVRESEEAST